MQWPLALLLGLVTGGTLAFIYNRQLRRRVNRLEIELTEMELERDSFKEMNNNCLDHASQVLTRWMDYLSTHGGTDEEYY